MAKISSETTLLNSLIDYVSDVKPYHTKIKQLTNELNFSDAFNLSVKDEEFIESGGTTVKTFPKFEIFLQNIWTSDDLGGFKLYNISSQQDLDRYFRIPATVFPRFSLNDHVDYGQTPPGDDPATFNFSDPNEDGIPDSTMPWTGGETSSHFTGARQLAVQAQITDLNVVIYGEYLQQGTDPGVGGIYNYYYDLSFTVDATDAVTYDFGRDVANGLRVFVVEPSGAAADRSPNVVSDDNITFTIYNLQASYSPTAADLEALPPPTLANINLFCKFGEMKANRSTIVYWTRTGRYALPFHEGSRVYLNSVLQTFPGDYVVDDSRSWIQFLIRPDDADKIDVNIFKTDRLFIAYNEPFDYNVSRGYDDYGYDNLPYDSEPDEVSGVDSDSFTLTVLGAGTSIFTSHQANPGTAGIKGQLVVDDVNPSIPSGSVWVIKAVGPWKFSVQKTVPTVGPVTYAYFKQPYADGLIAFTILPSWTSYYLSPDPTSYADLIGQPTDPTHFLVNLLVKTEHGVVTDPLPPTHSPVQILTLGKIKKIRDLGTNVINEYGGSPIESDYYAFVLDSVPKRGTYIELRIEQQGQLNPWVNLDVTDSFTLTQVIQDTGEIVISKPTTS